MAELTATLANAFVGANVKKRCRRSKRKCDVSALQATLSNFELCVSYFRDLLPSFNGFKIFENPLDDDFRRLLIFEALHFFPWSPTSLKNVELLAALPYSSSRVIVRGSKSIDPPPNVKQECVSSEMKEIVHLYRLAQLFHSLSLFDTGDEI